MRLSRKFQLAAIFLAFILVFIWALFVGPTGVGDAFIIRTIRLPRIVSGGLVGIALACSGAILQGLLRNALADPYILGTSSGAALGALAGFNLRASFPQWVTLSTLSFYLCVFLGAFLATIASYLIARTEKQVPRINLLLAGVIVSTFCGACILLFFTLQHRDSFSMFFFLMGSLVEGNWNLILASGGIILLGAGISYLFSKELNILSLGEEKAKHLGIEVERLKLVLFALSSFMVSAAVAISGTIGFIGLIVPHVARLLVGADNKFLIPASAIMGGTILIISDAIARTVANPIEIPVGVITALLGAPFFLYLLRKKRKEKYF